MVVVTKGATSWSNWLVWLVNVGGLYAIDDFLTPLVDEDDEHEEDIDDDGEDNKDDGDDIGVCGRLWWLLVVVVVGVVVLAELGNELVKLTAAPGGANLSK